MTDTDSRPPADPGIAVIIPARDEGEALGATLRSLAAQTARPGRIVVVVNNSADGTEGIARRFAALPGAPPTDVLVMPGRNPFKKAGALNHGLRHLIGWRRFTEDRAPLPPGIRYVLTMDGDTDLEPHFLERARHVMEADRRLGGVTPHAWASRSTAPPPGPGCCSYCKKQNTAGSLRPGCAATCTPCPAPGRSTGLPR